MMFSVPQVGSPYLRQVLRTLCKFSVPQVGSPYLKQVLRTFGSFPYLQQVLRTFGSSPYLWQFSMPLVGSPYLRQFSVPQVGTSYLRLTFGSPKVIQVIVIISDFYTDTFKHSKSRFTACASPRFSFFRTPFVVIRRLCSNVYFCYLLRFNHILDLRFRSLQVINTCVKSPTSLDCRGLHRPVRYRVGGQLGQVAQGAYILSCTWTTQWLVQRSKVQEDVQLLLPLCLAFTVLEAPHLYRCP